MAQNVSVNVLGDEFSGALNFSLAVSVDSNLNPISLKVVDTQLNDDKKIRFYGFWGTIGAVAAGVGIGLAIG